MHLFILAAATLALAAVLWYTQASSTAKNVPPPEVDAAQILRRTLAEDPRMVDALAEAVRGLENLMAHPELGGPGFLLIQFPMEADGASAVVTAQYPNIREGLYRRVVRQELERDDLAAAGMMEALLAQKPDFETESGGVVMVSLKTGEVPPELTACLNSRRERGIALGIVAEHLEEHIPGFSVRVFGTDLLLSPIRERDKDAPAVFTSTDE